MIPARIVVLGGSTVHGEGDPEHGGFVSLLKTWHETANPPKNRVFNLGIGGDTVSAMLSRGPSECAARRPNLILLYPGLNDTRRKDSRSASRATTPELFDEMLRSLVVRLRELAPVVLISSVPLDESRTTPFHGGFYFLASDAELTAQAVSSIASTEKVYYLPIFERWQNRGNRSELMFDGLHCNAFGHQELFSEVRSFLIEKFGEKAT